MSSTRWVVGLSHAFSEYRWLLLNIDGCKKMKVVS